MSMNACWMDPSWAQDKGMGIEGLLPLLTFCLGWCRECDARVARVKARGEEAKARMAEEHAAAVALGPAAEVWIMGLREGHTLCEGAIFHGPLFRPFYLFRALHLGAGMRAPPGAVGGPGIRAVGGDGFHR